MDDIPTKLETIKASNQLSPEAFENLKTWLTRDDLAEFRPAIIELIDAQAYQQLEDAFYTRIRVGTGGIRGPIGVGSNRINKRTIAEAAQGLSDFIADFGQEAKQKGVVVGYDARRFSKVFGELCCEVFAANGIKAYIFDSLRATPEVSFAVRYLKTVAGVQITASHNPRTDNGFKFYWTDGGQVVPPLDQKFMDLVQTVNKIQSLPFEEAVKQKKVEVISQDIDKAYIAAIRGLSLSTSRTAKVVFSPIHGSGSTNVLPVLEQEGYTVEVVPEQAKPDENFPTAKGDLINPEYREVMELPINLAEKLGFDVAINSDPDADRIGVAAKKHLASSAMQFLTGNEVGIALVHYILSELEKKKALTPNNLVIETSVTTSLIADIAKDFGIKAESNLLVGFKFIGEIIEKLANKNDFIFAAEESLGYLAGTFVRDKDAAIAALFLAELISKLKDNNKTLIDYLDEIYAKYGYYKNILHMVELPGKKGFVNIKNIMVGFRTSPPKEMAGFKVLETIDRLPEGQRTGEDYKVGATGDQLSFILSNDQKSKLTVRPSGTEPKIKYYIQHYGSSSGDLNAVRARIDAEAESMEQNLVAHGKQFIHED